MCLAVPGKIIEHSGNIAKVDFGDGTVRNVNTMLVDVKVGDYVLVHAGFAIEKVSREGAEETLKLLKQMLEE
jgi:hydrogenase expression/formation protein HypC